MVDVSSGQLLTFDRKLPGTQWCQFTLPSGTQTLSLVVGKLVKTA